jgi:hypothetical protein
MNGIGRKLMRILAPLLAAGLAACQGCGTPGQPLEPAAAGLQAAAARATGENIATAKVYRGLAHPRKQWLRFRRELREVPHFETGGFHFHREAVTVPAGLAAEVGALYADPANHRQRRAIKPCPGFHPDWMLVWTAPGGGAAWLQVCHGCHEWKLAAPGVLAYTDIAGGAHARLLQLLPR